MARKRRRGKGENRLALDRQRGEARFPAAVWPERAIVQEALAQIPWHHHLALLEKLDDSAERHWYARQAMEHGWSHNILVLQIDGRAHQRHGKAITNFDRHLLTPPHAEAAKLAAANLPARRSPSEGEKEPGYGG